MYPKVQIRVYYVSMYYFPHVVELWMAPLRSLVVGCPERMGINRLVTSSNIIMLLLLFAGSTVGLPLPLRIAIYFLLGLMQCSTILLGIILHRSCSVLADFTDLFSELLVSFQGASTSSRSLTFYLNILSHMCIPSLASPLGVVPEGRWNTIVYPHYIFDCVL